MIEGICKCKDSVKFNEYLDQEDGRWRKYERNFIIRRNFGKHSRGFKVCKICKKVRRK